MRDETVGGEWEHWAFSLIITFMFLWLDIRQIHIFDASEKVL